MANAHVASCTADAGPGVVIEPAKLCDTAAAENHLCGRFLTHLSPPGMHSRSKCDRSTWHATAVPITLPCSTEWR